MLAGQGWGPKEGLGSGSHMISVFGTWGGAEPEGGCGSGYRERGQGWWGIRNISLLSGAG